MPGTVVEGSPRAAGAASSPSPVGGRTEMLRARGRDLRDLVRGTRVGRLAAEGAVTLLAVLLAGLLTFLAVLHVDAAAGDAARRGEPRTAAARTLIRGLTEADESSAVAFLAHTDPPGPRETYRTALTRAGGALAVLAGTPEGGERSGADPGDPVTRLATGLPAYAGLVETARAFDQQGLPVGSAYLREASSFLASTLLPAAQAVEAAETAELDDEQAAAGLNVLTVLALLALVAALVAIVRLHRTVARTTKRRYTPGVARAGGAVALLLVWGLVALGVTAIATATARSAGTRPDALVTAARSTALQARTEEVLTLVARGSGGRYEDDAARRLADLTDPHGALARARDAVGSSDGGPAMRDTAAPATRWRTDHARLRALDDGGDYPAAVTAALDPRGTTADSGELDADLGRASGAAAATAASGTATADAGPTLLALGTVALTAVALAGIVVGLWPRLQEYR